MAAALEHYSEHPLARAILDGAKSRGIAPAAADRFEALTGAGAKGVTQGMAWHVGHPDLFARLGVDLKLKKVVEPVRALQEQGKTVVLLGTGEKSPG